MKKVLMPFSGILLFMLLHQFAHADISLPAIFGDGMVLQQSSKVSIWGWANKNTTVTVIASWDKKKHTTQSGASGKWSMQIETPAAGGPYSIEIKDSKTLMLNDVLIGEVWLCSGQSNMEMPVRGFRNQPITGSNEILLESRNPQLRLFTVKKNAAAQPTDTCGGKWEYSTPQTAEGFSAIGYQFGAMLQKKLNVPVGIIASSWGGTTIQAWMEEESMKPFPEVKLVTLYDTTKNKQQFPTSLYNGMISPVAGYGIKGFLWYQGESNWREPQVYLKLFPAMVEQWRKVWNMQTALPFYYVQIAPFRAPDSTRTGRHLREAQLKAAEKIPNSGMVVTMDIGAERLIHPPDKITVAKRLLYWALAQNYGYTGLPFSGPVYKSMTVNKDKINLQFDYAPNGLMITGDSLQYFEIAGADKVFYPAMARIQGNGSIDVWGSDVKNPVAVRYGFKEWVIGDLFNTAGLPASSFRTDEW